MTAAKALAQVQAALEPKGYYQPTPGPWYSSFDGVYEGEDRDSRRGRIASSCGTRGKTEPEEANNKYIAACNPANMREILAAYAAMVEENQRLREALIAWKTAEKYRDTYQHIREAHADISDAYDSAIAMRDAALAKPDHLQE